MVEYLLLLWLILPTIVLAWEPDYILRVSQETITPDGFPRLSVVVNGTVPGPLLTFMEGQHVWVRVYNDLADQNTTMHWHGFTQFLAPFSDGTPMISGWPIQPGRYFDYEFQLQPGHIGTYWYHSHVGMQLHTAQGPIIVKATDPVAPVEYDEEIVMMMGEYYHASDEKIEAGLLNQTLFAWLGDPNTVLVNGNGVCNATALPSGYTCDSAGLHKQLVKPNTKYRVRVIGATVLSYLSMALEGHNMTLFEVDGTFIEPLPITNLEVHSGERYSVLIETPAIPAKSEFYWRIRSIWRPTHPIAASLWSYDWSLTETASYNRSYTTDPIPSDLVSRVFLPNESFGWIANDFKEWKSKDYPPDDSQVTRTIYLDGEQKVSGIAGFQWRINNKTVQETNQGAPFLLNFYSKDVDDRSPDYSTALANGGWDAELNAYPAKLGEVLDIVFQNRAGQTSGQVETHPWHMHGRKYWDMGAGNGNFSYDAYHAMASSQTGSPIRRDTSVVYASPGASYLGASNAIGKEDPGGWRLVRIRVDDPGAWLVHCHINPHQSMGMAVLMLFGAENLPAIPSYILDEYSLGGDAFGSNSTNEPRRWFTY